MKKILLLSVLFIFYFNNSESGIKSYYDGSGPLKISNEVAKNFSDYVKKTLKGKMGDKPVTFWVTEDYIFTNSPAAFHLFMGIFLENILSPYCSPSI